MTNRKATRLASETAPGAFFFVNATSAVVFADRSQDFLIINLFTGDTCRRCRLEHIPAFVGMHENELWSVGLNMLVHRRSASAGEGGGGLPQSRCVS